MKCFQSTELPYHPKQGSFISNVYQEWSPGSAGFQAVPGKHLKDHRCALDSIDDSALMSGNVPWHHLISREVAGGAEVLQLQPKAGDSFRQPLAASPSVAGASQRTKQLFEEVSTSLPQSMSWRSLICYWRMVWEGNILSHIPSAPWFPHRGNLSAQAELDPCHSLWKTQMQLQ